MYLLPAEVTANNHYLTAALPALRPRLWSFAQRLAGNRRDALDLVRRVCVHAFERPEEFPTGFATPNALFSLVHCVWFQQRAGAAAAAAFGSSAASGTRAQTSATPPARAAAAERAA